MLPFNPPASMETIRRFEQSYRIELPERFISLHATFDGRRRLENMFPSGWLSLEDIRTISDRWKANLERYFGTHWKTLSPAKVHPKDYVQPHLFHPRWIPFMRMKDVIWCMDYAPAEMGSYGQVLCVKVAKRLEQYSVSRVEHSFDQWFDSAAAQGNELSFENSDIRQAVERFKAQYRFDADRNSLTTPYAEEIRQHVQKHIGPVKGVFQDSEEQLSQPVDVLWVEPSNEHPFHTLVSCGMSAQAMPLPEDLSEGDAFRFSELVILLPPDWKVGSSEVQYNWPLQWLKVMARLPQKLNKWFGEGQVVTNGNETTLIANTPFAGMLLFPPLITLPGRFSILDAQDGNLLRFCALVPLTPQEIYYKQRHGLEALLKVFKRQQLVTEVVDCARVSSIK